MQAPEFPQTLIITAIYDEAPQVKTFVLRAADGYDIPYVAGQFLTFSFVLAGKEHRRSYSLSAAPEQEAGLQMTVKRVDNGYFSRWLTDRARVGDTLTCTGIAGLFTLPDDTQDKTLLFFAAGIGITPIFGLLRTWLQRKDGSKAVLVYSNRSREQVVFERQILELQSLSNERLAVEWLYSDNKQLSRTRLTRPLMDVLLRNHLHNATATLAYICGPADYRWLVQLLLEEAGLAPGQIRQEIFITERPPLLQVPPDQQPRTVTLYWQGKEYRLQVQYPDTILTAAKRAGIGIPYSCQAGRCSSCVARCVTGKVWMAYNEVLTEGDLRNGLVLPCTGYPVGGDVVLAY